MAEKFYLTSKDRDLIGRTIKRVEGAGRGQIPLHKRRRGGVDGGGGASVRTDLIPCVVSSAISGAEGWSLINWGVGECEEIDPDTGSVVGSPFEVLNRYFDPFSVGAPCFVAEFPFGRVVVNVGCSSGPE